MRNVALVATLMLAACGGGGGGGSVPVQVLVNIAPVITTASTLSLVENIVAVTTLSATDADGDPISWSIAGGEDSARFVVNGRQLNFASPPNYDAPADANSDNSYAVIVSASDGKTSVTQALTVTVSNSKEGVVVRQVGSIGEAWVGATQLKDGSIKLVSRTAIYRYDPAARTATQQLRLTAGGQGGRFLSITPTAAPLSLHTCWCRRGAAADRSMSGKSSAAPAGTSASSRNSSGRSPCTACRSIQQWRKSAVSLVTASAAAPALPLAASAYLPG